jgi:hypothetical protein
LGRKKKKYDGARSPYANRKVGKSIEYKCVADLKEKGYWAKRQPDQQQQGESAAIDVFCWNPFDREFWVIQVKRHRKLLMNNSAKSREERARIIAYAVKYGAIAYLCYLDKGLHYEQILK